MIATPQPPRSDDLGETATPAVEVADLSYTFPSREVPTLRDVSFSLPRGSWTVVAGATGSGKSTLLRAIVGLVPRLARGAMSGTVHLFGRDTRRQTAAEAAQLVGFVQQSPDDQICTTTVEAELAFGLENLNLPVAEIAARIATTAARFGLHDRLAQPTPFLSGGLKQRLTLAAVLAMRPQILVCDEPLSQLDSRAGAEFLDELRRLQAAGLTIVTSEHRLDEIVPYADRVLTLSDGRVIDDRFAATHPSASSTAHRKLEVSPRRQSAAFTTDAIVQIDGAAYRFPGDDRDVWSNVTATIHRGERIAVVGPNGAGKSTLLAVLAGELSPTAGRIAWHGRSSAWPATLVPQRVDLTLFEPTVRRELAFGPRQMRWSPTVVDERVATAAQLFRIDRYLDDAPQSLSQGERVRTAIAAALALAPRVLLLDEPTTGQDLPTMRALMDVLMQCVGAPGGPEAMLFSTHDLATAVRYADRIWIVADGRLVADVAPQQFADDAALQRRASGGGRG
jgi:energy-coupling factor transporter ATP-binding protein EcfA2